MLIYEQYFILLHFHNIFIFIIKISVHILTIPIKINVIKSVNTVLLHCMQYYRCALK